jgi:hypothetical protein
MACEAAIKNTSAPDMKTMRKTYVPIANARGQSLLEMAFLLPVLLLIIVGSLEFGREYSIKNLPYKQHP